MAARRRWNGVGDRVDARRIVTARDLYIHRESSDHRYTTGHATYAAASTGWAKKRGHRLMTIILANLNRFKQEVFFSGKFLGKFAVKRILKIPPHLAYVATLPCETLMSAKKEAFNDKLQCSVAAYLRYGEVIDN